METTRTKVEETGEQCYGNKDVCENSKIQHKYEDELKINKL